MMTEAKMKALATELKAENPTAAVTLTKDARHIIVLKAPEWLK